MDKVTDPEQIRSLIASVKFWYHQIELAPGITTPGANFSLKVLENLDALGLPKNAQSLRVLDIGCRDGYFAFEMERRGAEVIAIDYAPAETTGFPIAASVLQSKVPYIVDNVYDLTPETYGLFDIVFFLGVIYHLRNPLLALDRIRKLMKPGGLLFVESALSTDEAIKNLDIPVWRFYPRNTLNNDDTNKWAPNLLGLSMVVEEAGFSILHNLQLGQHGYARGYAMAQAVSDIRQEHFQKLDSSKGLFGVKKTLGQE
jgi:tRNA (mo5U34)-methyltransferase